MNLRKTFLCLTLCAILVMTLAPITAGAATIGGACGDSLTWTLDDAGTLTISGTGAMTEYYSSPDVPWDSLREEIAQVKISSGVTHIGDTGRFSWGTVPVFVDGNNPCYSSDSYGVLFNKNKTLLISAPREMTGSYTVPNTVEELAAFAFVSSRLTQILLPDNLEIIGDHAFMNCHDLEEIVIPYRVYSIGRLAFSTGYISGYIWVDEDNLNFSSDEYGVLFNKDKTILIHAPSGLSGSYTVPSTVKTIDMYSFFSLQYVTEVSIPESVTRIEECAFAGCNRLAVIRGCKGLQDVGRAAFSGCDSLTDVYYDGTMNQAMRIRIQPQNDSLANATFHFAPAIAGDMDGDGDKDTDDAVYLLLNVMFGDEDYPLAQ